MCDQVFQILGAQFFVKPESPHASDENVNCRSRILITITLILGLAATGALAIAIATDFWIFTKEPKLLKYVGVNGTLVLFDVHAGLWRGCYTYTILDPPSGSVTHDCFSINYKASYKRGAQAGDETKPESTWAILRGIRKASPLIMSSLVIIIAGLFSATIGNARFNNKTLFGAVLYIYGALILALGVIFYISAVNDEMAHLKKPEDPKMPPFSKVYGWAFFFAGSSFITAMIAAVINITLYQKRFTEYGDLIQIIPGLDKKSNISLNREVDTQEEDLRYEDQEQCPTIIL